MLTSVSLIEETKFPNLFPYSKSKNSPLTKNLIKWQWIIFFKATNNPQKTQIPRPCIPKFYIHPWQSGVKKLPAEKLRKSLNPSHIFYVKNIFCWISIDLQDTTLRFNKLWVISLFVKNQIKKKTFRNPCGWKIVAKVSPDLRLAKNTSLAIKSVSFSPWSLPIFFFNTDNQASYRPIFDS